jgi:hypothetical protein
LSWQIVPSFIIETISGKDSAKVDRVMRVVMDSVKLDIKKLKQAAKGPAKKSTRSKNDHV